jgi:hypothetical protein
MVSTSTSTGGSYFGVKFSDITVDRLLKYMEHYEIPNQVCRDDIHATIMYCDHTLPKDDYIAEGPIKPMILADFKCFSVWETQATPRRAATQCLVMKFKCPALMWRNLYLMSRYYPNTKFRQYQPHITLSYNIKDFSVSHLLGFEHPIEVVEEYQIERNTESLHSVYTRIQGGLGGNI